MVPSNQYGGTADAVSDLVTSLRSRRWNCVTASIENGRVTTSPSPSIVKPAPAVITCLFESMKLVAPVCAGTGVGS